MEPIKKALPSTILEAEKQNMAYNFVKAVLNELFGSNGWDIYKESVNGKMKTFIKLKGEGEP